MDPVRVLIVDDHTMFREGIAALLRDQPDMEVVGEAGDGCEAVQKAAELMPDVILMDLRMPRCDGLQATQMIKKSLPYAKIVILTMSEKDEDLFQAMKAGAKGYILKSATTRELMAAITVIAQGHAVIAPSMAERLLAEFSALANPANPPDATVPELTKRENEILGMVGQGLSNKEISHRLSVAEATVKTHLSNILEKLHLHSRVEAALFAAEQGRLRAG